MKESILLMQTLLSKTEIHPLFTKCQFHKAGSKTILNYSLIHRLSWLLDVINIKNNQAIANQDYHFLSRIAGFLEERAAIEFPDRMVKWVPSGGAHFTTKVKSCRFIDSRLW